MSLQEIVRRRENTHYIAKTYKVDHAFIAVYGETLKSMAEKFAREELSGYGGDLAERFADSLFTFPNTTFVTLQTKKTNEIVGFTSFISPATGPNGNQIKWSNEDAQYFVGHGIYQDRRDYLGEIPFKTAEVRLTYIAPEYRGKNHGWSLLMGSLDRAVIASGLAYMIRFVRVDNQYSDKVKKRYRDAIIVDGSLRLDSLGGKPQRFYRIDVGKMRRP